MAKNQNILFVEHSVKRGLCSDVRIPFQKSTIKIKHIFAEGSKYPGDIAFNLYTDTTLRHYIRDNIFDALEYSVSYIMICTYNIINRQASKCEIIVIAKYCVKYIIIHFNPKYYTKCQKVVEVQKMTLCKLVLFYNKLCTFKIFCEYPFCVPPKSKFEACNQVIIINCYNIICYIIITSHHILYQAYGYVKIVY